MSFVYAALLLAGVAELLFAWLPRSRPLQFAVGPLMVVALIGIMSPAPPSTPTGDRPPPVADR